MKERDKLNLGNFFTLGILLFHIWSQSEIRSFWCQILHKHRYHKGNWVMQANNMTNRNYFMCYCNWKKDVCLWRNYLTSYFEVIFILFLLHLKVSLFTYVSDDGDWKWKNITLLSLFLIQSYSYVCWDGIRRYI